MLLDLENNAEVFEIKIPSRIKSWLLEKPNTFDSVEGCMEDVVRLAYKSGAPAAAGIYNQLNGRRVAGYADLGPAAQFDAASLTVLWAQMLDWASDRKVGPFRLVTTAPPSLACVPRLINAKVREVVYGSTVDEVQRSGVILAGTRDPVFEELIRGAGVAVKARIHETKCWLLLMDYKKHHGILTNSNHNPVLSAPTH